jgi:hypothetical protein
MIFDKEGKDLKCPNCGCGAKLINSKEVYGTSYGLMWVCMNFPKCNYRVTCKKGTATPTGELADEDLRNLRKKIYDKIDSIYKGKRDHTPQLYEDLGIKFSMIPFKISNLDKNICMKVLEFLNRNY